MERLFLIGGSGFIGKNIVENLYRGYDIVVFDRSIDKEYFEQYTMVEKYEINLIEDSIDKNIEPPDYIINLASIVTADRDLDLFDDMILTNLKILMNLYKRFKDCKTLKLFIQFGTSEEYGCVPSPYKEDMRECPYSPYALVKQLTVNTALMLYRNYSFPTMVVRPGNLFGKYQNKQKFIPYVISSLKDNKDLNVTLCEQKRDFIYAEDFVICINKILENYDKVKGEILNVSSGKSISLKEIIETLKAELHSCSKINYGAIPYRENEAMDLKCSVEKFEKLTLMHINFDVKNRLKELARQ